MQKKLIALAVAAAAAAPAFAQSNVTVYGRIDMGYTYSGSHSGDAESRNGIDSGQLQPSFIGFKGTEDLGNGLKVGFDFQTRLNIDTNEELDFAGSNSRRDAFLFLSGGFGTVAAGRLTTPQNAFLGSLDPFLDSAITGFSTNYTQGAALLAGTNITRLDNTVAYISPSFSGLKVTAAYTASALNNEQADDDLDANIWAISPVYSNGPLTVGANYHRVKLDAADATEKVWDLGAAYDFGMVKLSAAYGQDKLEVGSDDAKVKQWFVAATVPVSAAGNVLLAYGQQEIDDVDNSNNDRFSIGYHHSLSKRTTVYAQYGDYDIEENSLAGEGYESKFGLGVRHTF
ncbi:porin [Thauera sp. 63]|uniref:porin n=1 Tax=Thauera sp. 63 TaxID=497321 RepID=UPI0002CE5324|nr:porin [Thauera sp. 63]ENO75049.1 outer membrane porin protein [Thauera sp. 63]